MFLRISWSDRRLQLPPTMKEGDSISVDPSIMDRLWVPDVYFYGGRKYHRLKLLTEIGFFRVYWDKSMWYSGL